MKKLMLMVGCVGLLLAGQAHADIGPPPGQKRVPLTHLISTEKDYPDYLFFSVMGGDMATPIKLDAKTAGKVVAGGGRYRTAQLVAIPVAEAKKFNSEKELLAAVAAQKIEGMVKGKMNFDAFTVVKESDKRNKIEMEYTLDKIDPKEGLIISVRNGKSPEPNEDEAGSEAPGVTAYSPRGGVWVAGLAATLGVLLAGFWLARRTRTG